MKIKYTGRHSGGVFVAVGGGREIACEVGKPVDVPAEVGKRLLDEQPDSFDEVKTPKKAQEG